MINLSIDNNPIESIQGCSILEVCEDLGVVIPRFCYHEILSVAGNCRMCVIEVDTVEKPVASCATEAKDGMDIFTNNAFVKKARENVVELLLINHPLDCPICDQAGECDLQDQAKAYGSSQSRFFEKKKTSEDKLCNPFIKTIMTRCITCTRCVRYASEVAGVEYFGTLNRGTVTEIGSYISKPFLSEISANVVDLCPVGALNSEPYSYHGRPWELRTTESTDISDSLGSNYYINHKENSIHRILPKPNKNINDTIISDIARLSYEYSKEKRILNAISNKKENSPLKEEVLYKKISQELNNKKAINLIIDENIDLETLKYINHLKKIKGYEIFVNQKTNITSNNIIVNDQYSIKEHFEKVKNFFFFIGINLRTESPVLNSKVRFKNRVHNTQIITSGFNFENNISNDLTFLSIKDILTSFEGSFNKRSYNNVTSQNTLVVFGKGLFQRFKNYYTIKGLFKNLSKKHEILELYTNSNSEITKMFKTKNLNNKTKNQSNIYLNLADNTNIRKVFHKNTKELSIWVNSNTSVLGSKNDYVLPSKTHFEEKQEYVSLGYRFQKTEKATEIKPEVKKTSNIVHKLFSTQENIKDSVYIADTLKENNEELDIADYHKSLSNLGLDAISLFHMYPIKQEKRNYYENSRITDNSSHLIAAAETYNEHYNNL